MKEKKIEEWQEDYKEILRKESYTEKETQECGEHIAHLAKMHDLFKQSLRTRQLHNEKNNTREIRRGV